MIDDASSPDEHDTTIVDWDSARRNIPGGHEGVVELAGMMQEECARLTAEIREGLDGARLARVRRAAHTLRGAALHFGAGPVIEAATAVQSFAAAGALEAARKAWPRLEGLVDRLVEELARADERAVEGPEHDPS